MLRLFQLDIALCYPYCPNDNLAKYCCIRTLGWSNQILFGSVAKVLWSVAKVIWSVAKELWSVAKVLGSLLR